MYMVHFARSTLFLSHVRMKSMAFSCKSVCQQELELASGMEHFHASHYVICHLPNEHLPNELKSAENLKTFKRLITNWDGPSCRCSACQCLPMQNALKI